MVVRVTCWPCVSVVAVSSVTVSVRVDDRVNVVDPVEVVVVVNLSVVVSVLVTVLACEDVTTKKPATPIRTPTTSSPIAARLDTPTRRIPTAAAPNLIELLYSDQNELHQP